MQKQEIPPFALRHSGCDLALNQLAVLQAIRRPPWRRYECSLNSWGPLGPLSTVTTWWVAAAPVHTNRAVISRCANQRAAGWDCFVSSTVQHPVLSTEGPLMCGYCFHWMTTVKVPHFVHSNLRYLPSGLSFIVMAEGKCWYKNNLWCDYLG